MSDLVGAGLVAGLIVLVAVLLTLCDKRLRKKRTLHLAAVASQLGLAFTRGKDNQIVEEFRSHLRSLSAWGSAHNVLRGEVQGRELLIFDYRYERFDHTTCDTLLLLKGRSDDLPALTLEPNGLSHKCFEVLGRAYVTFESRPEFSRLYRLHGTDEAAIRAVFTDDLLAFCEARPGLTISVRDGIMLYYRQDRYVSPSDIPDVYADGLTAYTLLRGQDPIPAGSHDK